MDRWARFLGEAALIGGSVTWAAIVGAVGASFTLGESVANHQLRA
ncbi:hypothetical protein ACFQU2_25145 [Siccirubricoccus deserti]|nr:hypothetical protein [Siccirubricoccus deserti]